MKVHLERDVPQLGKRGQIVDVSDAYARNALLPKKFAVLATKATLLAAERQQLQQQVSQERQRVELEALMQKLPGESITLTGRASPQGKLFAAIKTEAIRRALADRFRVDLTHMRCEPDHLKTVGTHQVMVIIDDHHRAPITIVIAHAEK